MPANDIAAAEFKGHCLQLLDEVARTGEPLAIRKRGRAVAQTCRYHRLAPCTAHCAARW
jgi:antitoxin (DNA-binding transcriptional repressor) of toxin-antitoxin stability system